tara:strand:+ start:715 stop:879 length:165 start_codon:yes stop_codon:yes gene_type:complete
MENAISIVELLCDNTTTTPRLPRRSARGLRVVGFERSKRNEAKRAHGNARNVRW